MNINLKTRDNSNFNPPLGVRGNIIRIFQTLQIFLLLAVSTSAQHRTDTIGYTIDARFNGGTGSYAPFLSTANQYDRYSFTPNSGTLWGTVHKEIQNIRLFDYGFGAELDGNVSKKESRFFPGELYIQGKAWFLNVFAGCKQETFGNQDAELSAGGMLWSQNSRPIPNISIETNGFIDVPYTKGYVAVKGGLSHGWFDENIGTKNLLLHHKYAAIQVGGSFPVTINYGIQHVVQWGGVSTKYGTMPVTLDNYLRIFLGEHGGSTANESDQINTLGNHIISQNLGFDLKLKSIVVSLYWQNLTEDPPVKFITAAPNVMDGLWGLSVHFPTFKPFNAFVLEYMSTTDQSGPWHDLDGVIYGGTDGYYQNGSTPGGWSYHGMTIGNPWLTSPNYNSNGSTTTENNFVRLYYFSGKGSIHTTNYRVSVAYSENFGSYDSSNGYKLSYANCKKQLSYQLETFTPVNFLRNTKISLGIAGDSGAMYGNNLAFIFGVSYTGFFGY
jgi:hypothetical protein